MEPVNAPARIRSSCSSSTPFCCPSMSWNTPDGIPAPSSASATIAAVRRDSSGCPECAFTTTGHPAASAAAESPPATENANGKFDAAKFSTGPTGSSTRRTSGRAPIT